MTDQRNSYVDGKAIKETDKAVLLRTDNAEFWIPRSVIVDGDAIELGDEDILVANWWLRQEGRL